MQDAILEYREAQKLDLEYTKGRMKKDAGYPEGAGATEVTDISRQK